MDIPVEFGTQWNWFVNFLNMQVSYQVSMPCIATAGFLELGISFSINENGHSCGPPKPAKNNKTTIPSTCAKVPFISWSLIHCRREEDSLHSKKNNCSWWFQLFFIFTPHLGMISNLTDIFQMGWNHQLDIFSLFFLCGSQQPSQWLDRFN